MQLSRASRRPLVLFTFLSLLVAANALAGVTITVNDATDAIHATLPADCANSGTGTCGLNDAITFANADYIAHPTNAPYTIDFSVALVTVKAGLPAIQEPMTIDGSFGAPRVELVGGSGATGLVVDALAAATSTAGSGVVIKNLVIRNFTGDAIDLTGGGHQVFNCYIGVDKTGTVAQPNTGSGISITTPALGAYTFPPPSNVPFVQIGDPADTATGNVISGNTTNGITITSQRTELNVVANNKIGTDVNGTTAIPNGQFGVQITGDAFSNTIGPGNLISGNNSNTGSDGINITGAVLGPNVVNGNIIGPAKDLTNLDAVKFGNGEDGIRITSTRADPAVTEVADITNNVIGFNTEHGIFMTGSCEKVVVTGNFIGLSQNPPGSGPFLNIANQMDGIHISTPGHVIGGSTPALANLISANKNSGIATSSSSATDLTIQGNIIGRDGTNTSNFSNVLDGITLSAGGDNLIGGAVPGQGNIIAGNGRNGIKLINNSWANLITHNSIFLNHQLVNGIGIDLDVVSDAPDPTDNSTPGPDPNLSYANFGQNAPVINTLILPSYNVGGGTTSVTWSLTTSATTPVTLDFYMSDAPGFSNNGEGQTWLFSTTTATDITGAASATTTFPSVVTATKYITMTATSTDAVTTRPGANPNGPANNTSEFSNAVQVPDPATHFSVTSPSPVTAGTPSTVTVTALTATNAVATTYSGMVHFTSSDVAATLQSDTTLTNGTGTFPVTLKTVGTQTITATDTVTASITGTSGSIVVNPGPAVVFIVGAPATATAGSAFSVTVTAKDAFNNTATGYGGTVHFTSSDGAATLPSGTLTNGTGGFSVTLRTAGSQSVTATDSVTLSITGTTLVTVSSAAATHLNVGAPSSATAGSPFSVTVTAQDQFNNTATGYGGMVHFSSSDGLAILHADSTLASGVGTFSTTLETAGNQTVTATDTVTSSITGTSNTIAVNPASATHFTVVAPVSATAGISFSITVTARDQFNNTATGYGGMVHFTSTDGVATLPVDSPLTNGVGTFPANLKSAGSQTITATDTVTSSITGTSGTITVSAPPRARGDFNGDGKSDLFWRDITGENEVWLMNGSNILTAASESQVSSTFSVVGIGDFDGDGNADILWRSTSGALVIWFMNGTTISSTAYVGSVPTNWQVVEVGDFNGDGKADIFWRSSSGDNMMYLMNGAVITTGVSLPAVPNLAWQVVGVGDLNGDGKDDLVWRNPVCGCESVWMMNGTSAPATAALPKILDPNWMIAGVGDINGDGKADLIWRNVATSEVSAWLMNGGSATLTGSLPNVGPVWVLVRVADFNGDGKADLMWQNTSTGENAVWFLNGISVASSGAMPALPSVWALQGKP